jgi:HK97 family phage prohead protease
MAAHHKRTAGERVYLKSATMAAPETVPMIDREKRLVRGTITASTLDLDREVVIAAGLDRSYFPDAVKAVYYNHDYRAMPVGTCERLDVRDDRLESTTRILSGPVGDDLLTAIEEGAIRGLSIGMSVSEASDPTPDEAKRWPGVRNVIRRATLLEYSVVAMPSNPVALMDLVSKGIVQRWTATLFGLPDSPVRKVYPVTGAAKRARVVIDSLGNIASARV